ncbi:alpha/beta fold hydrolase [Streptomyces sp. NPDC001941]|uniref:thioesterase II family protein n=1 Tax=Streptomyces sp. NPDC001941 TaxID=3154659 RepID=UPI00331B1C43
MSPHDPGSPAAELLPEPARKWIRPIAGGDGTGTTVVCLPHAGGSAGVFSAWADHLPSGLRVLGVQYPGRADRRDEPMPDDLPDLAQQIAFSLQWLDGPYTLLGHSMGAVLAYETCRKLAGLGIAGPDHLVVSASPPPDHPAAAGHDETSTDVSELPASVTGDDTAREHFEEVIAQDLRLLRGYETSNEPIEPPLTCLHNAEDPDMDQDIALGWQKFTTSAFHSAELPGGHFALFRDPASTWAALGREVGLRA